MNFPILVIVYVFVQISSCTDVPAEELFQTNPLISTSTYSSLDSNSETEIISSSNSAVIPSLEPESGESNQDGNDTTTISNLRSATFAKVTWNPVSSMLLSTDPLTKSPDYENTFASNSLQNTAEHSRTNAFNYQTSPSSFENLDLENELDSENRVTGTYKDLKTTLSDLPLLYAHKETFGIERPTDSSRISDGSVDYSLSESDNESTSGTTMEIDASSQYNVKNSTVIPISVSDHTAGETSFFASTTDISNFELSLESEETSSILTRDRTVMSDPNISATTKNMYDNLDRNNFRETASIVNETTTTKGIKFSYDENLISSTVSITELDAESIEQESKFGYSSIDTNSTFTESSEIHEPKETISFSEKSNEGLELTSRLNLETTPVSFLDQSGEGNKMITSTTTVGLKVTDTNDLTSENFPSKISDTSALDILANTRTSSFTVPTFLETSSDYNSLRENHTSTNTEHSSSPSSYTIPTMLSEQENLSIFPLVSNKFSATTDDSVTTASISTGSQLNTETEGSSESKTVSTEMEKTTWFRVPSTLPDDIISQTTASSLEKDKSSMYDIPTTISNIEKEDPEFSTSEKHAIPEIITSTYSTVNTFEVTNKLFTNIDSNITAELYFPSLKNQLSTVTQNDIEGSKITFPSHKHVDIESSTDSSTEQSTASQTIPHHLLPSTSHILTPTSVSSNDVDSNYSTIAFLPTNEETLRETSIDGFTEQSVPQTASDPISSTTFDQLFSSVTQNELSSQKPIQDLSTEETSTSRLESNTITDEISTSIPDSFSSHAASITEEISTAVPDSYSNPADVVTTEISSMSSETHREGKHIPFSTTSTLKVTGLSSEYGYRFVTTEKTPVIKAAVNDTEVHYMQIKIEDINSIDRTNMITAIIQFPADSVHKADMKTKLARTHQWLDKVLTKEFRNWTGDPFQKDEQDDVIPFGNISIFYVKPTPETNTSHITLTFIVYNAWRNRTLPVDFVPGTLNFYSKELKESINASAVYFYQGLSTENYDLLSAVFDKYGIMIFTICLAVVGITILVCIVVFYRKKSRQSIHYLADSKLQQNLQEAVGIDLTPASIILQDEKEKGSKICDDEGWLVPITDVPVAEDNSVPNIQDTKL